MAKPDHIEIYRHLKKTNCGYCQIRTCMAFALAVTRGEKQIADCPYVHPDAAKALQDRLGGTVRRRDGREELDERIEPLRREVSRLDLDAVAEGLGGSLEKGRLVISCMGKAFRIDEKGGIESKIHVNPWITVPLLKYIASSGQGDLSGEWISFDELSSGAIRAQYFSRRCEEPIRLLLDANEKLFADLMAKAALHANGYATTHLSHPTHGFSESTFGIRVLNPLRTNVESRYLAERIVIGDGGPAEAVLELSRRLKNNCIVSISAINRRTDDAKTVPFLDGATTLPCGPCRLSIAMSAPLLPVVTVRDVSGEFVTTVEHPLPAHAGTSESGIEHAIQDFAKILERYVAQYPAQYRWHEAIREPGNSNA